MAKRKVVTEEYVLERLAGGYGSGEGVGYKPWLNVRSFSSIGNRHRIASTKTGRTHHLMSNIERALFLYVENKQDFLDFKEGVAMDRDVTSAIAEDLGIAHPIYPGSKGVRCVMSFDGIAFHGTGAQTVERIAYDAKHSSALLDERTREKLRIHKAYAAYLGIRHVVVTEETFSEVFLRNLEWVRNGARKPREAKKVRGMFDSLPLAMYEEMALKRSRSEVHAYAKRFDKQHSVNPGTGMRVMQSLFWKGVLEAPMRRRLMPQMSLSATSIKCSAHGICFAS